MSLAVPPMGAARSQQLAGASRAASPSSSCFLHHFQPWLQPWLVAWGQHPLPLHTPVTTPVPAGKELLWRWVAVSPCWLGRGIGAGKSAWSRGDQGEHTNPGANLLPCTTVVAPFWVFGALPAPQPSPAMGSGLNRVMGTYTMVPYFWGCSWLVDQPPPCSPCCHICCLTLAPC